MWPKIRLQLGSLGSWIKYVHKWYYNKFRPKVRRPRRLLTILSFSSPQHWRPCYRAGSLMEVNSPPYKKVGICSPMRMNFACLLSAGSCRSPLPSTSKTLFNCKVCPMEVITLLWFITANCAFAPSLMICCTVVNFCARLRLSFKIVGPFLWRVSDERRHQFNSSSFLGT